MPHLAGFRRAVLLVDKRWWRQYLVGVGDAFRRAVFCRDKMVEAVDVGVWTEACGQHPRQIVDVDPRPHRRIGRLLRPDRPPPQPDQSHPGYRPDMIVYRSQRARAAGRPNGGHAQRRDCDGLMPHRVTAVHQKKAPDDISGPNACCLRSRSASCPGIHLFGGVLRHI
eukprot:1144004-Pyramimonas_sp.AAC.2